MHNIAWPPTVWRWAIIIYIELSDSSLRLNWSCLCLNWMYLILRAHVVAYSSSSGLLEGLESDCGALRSPETGAYIAKFGVRMRAVKMVLSVRPRCGVRRIPAFRLSDQVVILASGRTIVLQILKQSYGKSKSEALFQNQL